MVEKSELTDKLKVSIYESKLIRGFFKVFFSYDDGTVINKIASDFIAKFLNEVGMESTDIFISGNGITTSIIRDENLIVMIKLMFAPANPPF